MKPPSAPTFPPLNNANQSTKRSCDNCRGNHVLATFPDYQKCSPSQRFDIYSENNLCSNCLSNKHKKQICPSAKRCQTCSGCQHTKLLHDPGKIIKRPPTAFATSNSTSTNVTNQENQPVKHQCEPRSNSNANTQNYCMTPVKLSSVRQLLLPPAIPLVQMLPTKRISQSNINVNQEVTATQASHQNH